MKEAAKIWQNSKFMKRKEMKYRFIMERLDKILKLISEIQAPINSSIAPHKGKNYPHTKYVLLSCM